MKKEKYVKAYKLLQTNIINEFSGWVLIMLKAFVVLAILSVFLILTSTTNVSAFNYCSNSTNSVTDNSANVTGIWVSDIQQSPCPYGCNNMTGICERSPGYTGIEFTTFLLLFFISLGALVIGMARGSIASSAIALALFAVLAFSGFNIEYISGGQVVSYGTNIVLIWVCVIFLFVSLIALIYNAFHGREELIEGNDEEEEDE